MRKTRLTIAASFLLLIIAGVRPGLAAARGKADFTRYVALGTSYGAGVENNSMVLSHQPYAYPAIIARQAGLKVTTDCIGSSDPLCWQIPFVSEPGIGPELQLTSLSPLTLGPKATTNGSPINLNLARPYNNLSIPGSRVHDLLTLTGREPMGSNEGSAVQTGRFILRGLGTSVDQALALHPTFITIDTGGNDVLQAVLAGDPAALTPLDSFKTDFAAVLDKLIAGAPDAGIVVMGVADVAGLPFATTLPPVILNPATNTPLLINGAPVPLFADLGAGKLGVLPPGSLVTLNAIGFLSSGYGIPPQLAGAIPLPNAGKPLPAGVVITPDELAVISQRVTDVQAAIVSIAGARNVPVVDVVPFLTKARTTGFDYAGVHIDARYLQGGLFSYDGFHPSDIGYTLLANEWIKTINSSYGTHIPLASIAPLFANNAPDTLFLSTLPPPLSLQFGPGVSSIVTMAAGSANATATAARHRGVKPTQEAPTRRRGAKSGN